MKNKNLFLLAGAALLLFAFTRKKTRKGSVEVGPLTPIMIKANGGAQLTQTPEGLIPIYTFKGGEWLTLIKENNHNIIVEFIAPSGSTLRGLVAKTDVKYIR